ncbi:MAG TPA: NAD-binding protein [Acetobacteraceae bacterium]|nr:NAD-binding protein [Acetobacteraceae bacterium]
MLSLRIYRLGQWAPVVLLAILATALGLAGFMTCSGHPYCPGGGIGLEGALIRTLSLVRGEQSFTLGRDPFLLVAAQTLMFLALLLAGLMGSITLFMHNLRHDVKLARAQTLHGHVVVCGLGETGIEVVRGLKLGGHKVVAIARDEAEEAIAYCDRLGVPVLSGDATRAETLDHAGIARARALVATTGSDATNLDIVMAARARGRGSDPLLARPEIRAPWLIDAMTAPAAPIFDPGLLVHPLRTAEVSARLLLARAAFPRAAGPRPRIVLAGLGDLGTAILRHAALITFALPGTRLDILAYDSDAAARSAVLAAAPWGRALAQSLDLAIRPAWFGPPNEWGRATDWAAIETDLAARPPDAVIVALGNDDAALEAAFGLREALDRQRRFATPLAVRTRKERGVSQLLGRMSPRPLCPERLFGFGALSSLLGPAQLFEDGIDRMARAVHEDFLASSPDPAAAAAAPWERLSERFRRQNRDFADHIPVKLRHAGLRLVPGPGPSAALTEAEIETMARAEHHRWCLTLLAAGWRQGALRDDDARTHPQLAPWEALPDSARAYNLGAAAKIPRIAAEAGLAVRRLLPIDPLHPPAAPIAPDNIGLLAMDIADTPAWQAAQSLAETAAIVVRARGLARAAPRDLQRIADQFPAAAAAIEAWLDDAPEAAAAPAPLPAKAPPA